MVARLKIDSNETGLSYAEEYDLGILPGEPLRDGSGNAPGVPVWKFFEPNEYDDFGGELTLLARNPINSSRQRKKGSVTDLDADGGFNQDFTQTNLQDVLQGYMFADMRRKYNAEPTAVSATAYTVDDETGIAAGHLVFASGFGIAGNNGLKLVIGTDAGAIQCAGLSVEAAPPQGARLSLVGIQASSGDLSVSKAPGALPVLATAALDFAALGLIPGEWLYVGGDLAIDAFAVPGNNGFMRVRSVAAKSLVIDQAYSVLNTDDGAGKTVRLFFGSVLKNELGALIKRRSYQIERNLGAPDTAQPGQFQAEYLKGAVPEEFTLNVEQADKINVDMSFIAIDNEQRPSSVGLKAGIREPLIESDAFNTSSDFSAIRLAVIDPANPNPGALFAYMTEFSLTINNNLTVNKAIGVLGGFDVTAGTFEVSAEATAYFATVEAIQAVRENADVNFFMAVAKQNAGFIMDLPLIALGNARLEIEQDEPIMLPLDIDAATAAKINPNTDYTLLWMFYDYLPTRAQ